jgi:hypothetical protein
MCIRVSTAQCFLHAPETPAFFSVLFHNVVISYDYTAKVTIDEWMDKEHRWNNTDRGNPKYSEKTLWQCQFAHYKSYADWYGFGHVPLCSFPWFFHCNLISWIAKIMRLFFIQLKFISCFFHILASRCFSLDDHTVVGVILNILTEATCTDTIKSYVDYSNSGLQNLRIFKSPCPLMRNVCYITASLQYGYKLNSYWIGHFRSHVYPQHSCHFKLWVHTAWDWQYSD